KSAGVFGDVPRGFRFLVGGLIDLLLEQDLDRALGAHHGNLGGGPRQVDVASDVLGAHHVVGAAIGLAGNHRELGDRRLAEGVEKLGAVLDDPAMLLGYTGKEAWDVLEGDEWDVEAVAEAD